MLNDEIQHSNMGEVHVSRGSATHPSKGSGVCIPKFLGAHIYVHTV